MATYIEFSHYPAWDGNAITLSTLASDGEYSFQIGRCTGIAVGLVPAGQPSGGDYSRQTHTLYFDSTNVRAAERGTFVSPATRWHPGDTFRIRRVGRTVAYYQNAALLYSSYLDSVGEVALDAAIFARDDQVLDVALTALPGLASGEADLPPIAGSGHGGDIAAGRGSTGWSVQAAEIVSTASVALALPAFAGSGHGGDIAAGRGAWGNFISSAQALARPDYGSGYGRVGLVGFGREVALAPGAADLDLPALAGFGWDAADLAVGRGRFGPVGYGVGEGGGAGFFLLALPPLFGGDWTTVQAELSWLDAAIAFGASASGWSVEVELPALQGAIAVGRADGVAELPALAASLDLAIHAPWSVSATLPALDGAVALALHRAWRAEVGLPALQAEVAIGRADGAFELPALAASLDLAIHAPWSVSATLPSPEGLVEVTVRRSWAVQATLPAPEAALSAGWAIAAVLSAPIARPAIAPLSPDETTYAVNLDSGAITRLQIGTYSRMATAHGKLYALRDGKLYRLDGETDGGAPIAAHARFAPQTFDTTRHKRLFAVYLSVRQTARAVIETIADEQVAWRYRSAPELPGPYATLISRIGRAKPFITLGLVVRNQNGGPLDLGGFTLPARALPGGTR